VTTSVVSKDVVSAVNDTSSTVKKTAQRSLNQKDASSTIKSVVPVKKQFDPSGSAENVTPQTLTFSSSIQDLPGIPSTSTMFIHNWKRLQAHPELQSKYFQVCDLMRDLITRHLFVLSIQLIPLDKYSTVLSQSLETDVFPGIINILFNSYVK